MATVIDFPLAPVVRIDVDRDVVKARQRLQGRWSKHDAMANRQGFVDRVARVSGVVMVQLSRADGTSSDWYEATDVSPVSKSRPL